MIETKMNNSLRYVGKLALAFCLFGGALLSALLQSGCATMVRGNSDTVIIDSSPSGAEVRLSTGQYGITPCEFELKRKKNVRVTITKRGYKEVNTALVPSIDGGSLALGTAVNWLFLPLINDVVDYNSGANYSLKPNPLFVKLIPEDSSEDYIRVDPREVSKPRTIEAQAQIPTVSSDSFLLGFDRIKKDYEKIAEELGVDNVYGPLLPANAPELEIGISKNKGTLKVTNNGDVSLEEVLIAISDNRTTYWITRAEGLETGESVSLKDEDFKNEIEGQRKSGFDTVSRIEIWSPSYLLLVWEDN